VAEDGAVSRTANLVPEFQAQEVFDPRHLEGSPGSEAEDID
jgi:hypothetical protein